METLMSYRLIKYNKSSRVTIIVVEPALFEWCVLHECSDYLARSLQKQFHYYSCIKMWLVYCSKWYYDCASDIFPLLFEDYWAWSIIMLWWTWQMLRKRDVIWPKDNMLSLLWGYCCSACGYQYLLRKKCMGVYM